MTKNKMDEKVMKQVLGALGKMKADAEKRQEEQTWRPIDYPLSLHASLNRLTKVDLDHIRKSLELKNASSLKKADLIKLLEEKIPASLESVLKKLDQERYRLLRNLIKNDGRMKASPLEIHQLAYFQKLGLFYSGTFEGKKVYIMPQELVSALTVLNDVKIQKTMNRNTEWVRLTQGLLYYYGTLGVSQLIELLEKYMGEPLSLLEYLNVMHDAVSYYKQVRIDSIGYSNYRVFDSKRVLQEHQMRRNVEFFLFTKEQLLHAGASEFVDQNQGFKQFVRFLLEHYEMTKEEADQIAEECVYATRIGESPQDILEFLQSRLELNSVEAIQAIMGSVIDLMNNTREWFLKGHTPNELFEKEKEPLLSLPNSSKNNDETTKNKIGRNDPCPCGSKKKYKKCCGK